jgi:hypothetical protein
MRKQHQLKIRGPVVGGSRIPVHPTNPGIRRSVHEHEPRLAVSELGDIVLGFVFDKVILLPVLACVVLERKTNQEEKVRVGMPMKTAWSQGP